MSNNTTTFYLKTAKDADKLIDSKKEALKAKKASLAQEAEKEKARVAAEAAKARSAQLVQQFKDAEKNGKN